MWGLGRLGGLSFELEQCLARLEIEWNIHLSIDSRGSIYTNISHRHTTSWTFSPKYIRLAIVVRVSARRIGQSETNGSLFCWGSKARLTQQTKKEGKQLRSSLAEEFPARGLRL